MPDKRCDLILDGEDCGQPAVFKIMAGPYGSNLKPFWACPEHPRALYDDLVQTGFQVQEPTPV